MRRSIVLVGLAATSTPALAVPITIDFAGTVSGYTVTSDSVGADRTDTLSDLSALGSVTFDTSAGPPASTFPRSGGGGTYKQLAAAAPLIDAAGQSTAGSGAPRGQRGLVDFISASVAWANATSSPTPRVNYPLRVLHLGDELTVVNSVGGPDELELMDRFAWEDGASSSWYWISVSLKDFFIPDSGVPTGSELPGPLSRATGRVVVARGDDRPDGTSEFRLFIDIDSASVRAAQVPEPGTLALLSCGLLGFAALRRPLTSSGRLPRAFSGRQ